MSLLGGIEFAVGHWAVWVIVIIAIIAVVYVMVREADLPPWATKILGVCLKVLVICLMAVIAVVAVKFLMGLP